MPATSGASDPQLEGAEKPDLLQEGTSIACEVLPSGNTDEEPELVELMQRSMRAWTSTDVIRWTESLAALPAEWIVLVTGYFADNETDGDELADMKPKRMHKILKGLEEPVRTEAASHVLALRDQVLLVMQNSKAAEEEIKRPAANDVQGEVEIPAEEETAARAEAES